MVEWINYVPIEKIEKQFDTVLPSDLKKIILKYNKGQPRPNKIALGNGKHAEFYRLLSFNQSDNLSIYSCFDDDMKSKNIIPFAMTENGNYICIKDKKIILYNVEHQAEKQIFDTFSELIDNLY